MMIFIFLIVVIAAFFSGYFFGDRCKGTESRVMQAIQRDGIAAVEWVIEKFKKKVALNNEDK